MTLVWNEDVLIRSLRGWSSVDHRCGLNVVSYVHKSENRVRSDCRLLLLLLLIKAEIWPCLVCMSHLFEWRPKAALSWTKHTASSICPACISSVIYSLINALLTHSYHLRIFHHHTIHAWKIYFRFVTLWATNIWLVGDNQMVLLRWLCVQCMHAEGG